MTSLRVWKVGIAEVSIFIWSITILIKNKFKIKVDEFVKFFIVFDICLFIGYSIRTLKGVYTGSASSETLTFVFFNLFVFALSQFFQNESKTNIFKLLKLIFIWGFIIYFGLYLYSIFISKTFFGYSLWYGNRLSILANNPHQFVFFLGPSMISGLFLLKINVFNNRLSKLIVVLFIIGYFYMGILTKSSTLYATFFLLLIYVILFKNKSDVSMNRKNQYLLLMKITLIIIFLVIFRKEVYVGIIKFMESDENGLGRLNLWKLGIQTALRHPFFGLGPGAHLFNNSNVSFMEAHNTYIDVVLRGGIISLYQYMLMISKSIKSIKNNVYGKSMIIFFLIYGISGYSIRRITLWFFIMAITYIYKKTRVHILNEEQIKSDLLI